MPMYAYGCDTCHTFREDIRCIAQRHLSPKCDGCSKPMKLQISPVAGVVKDPAVPKRNTRTL